MFTLKDIKGAVVEKKEVPDGVLWNGKYTQSEAIFYNEAIDAQSSVRLRFNREKLANKLADELFDSWAKYAEFYGQPPHGTKQQLLAMMELGTLDAIIAADKDIIEVEK